MEERVEIMIPVDPQVAAALTARDREEIGRAISLMMREPPVTPLSMAIRAMKTEARSAGLTDEDVDAELAAHKAERRQRVHHAD